MSLFALITNPANKNGYGAYPFFGVQGCLLFGAQDHSSCGTHWAYKGCYIFPVNIKPTRPTTSTSKVYQEVYRVSQDRQEATAYLTAW